MDLIENLAVVNITNPNNHTYNGEITIITYDKNNNVINTVVPEFDYNASFKCSAILISSSNSNIELISNKTNTNYIGKKINLTYIKEGSKINIFLRYNNKFDAYRIAEEKRKAYELEQLRIEEERKKEELRLEAERKAEELRREEERKKEEERIQQEAREAEEKRKAEEARLKAEQEECERLELAKIEKERLEKELEQKRIEEQNRKAKEIIELKRYEDIVNTYDENSEDCKINISITDDTDNFIPGDFIIIISTHSGEKFKYNVESLPLNKNFVGENIIFLSKSNIYLFDGNGNTCENQLISIKNFSNVNNLKISYNKKVETISITDVFNDLEDKKMSIIIKGNKISVHTEYVNNSFMNRLKMAFGIIFSKKKTQDNFLVKIENN